MQRFDAAIIGSGLAGISLALRLAEHNQKVALITKQELLDGASAWAQGGIAAVLAGDDSTQEHIQDTQIAGAGLCHEPATRFVVEHGKEAINWLIERGVTFTRDDANETGYHLTREGGHSHRRIIHAEDATGRAVQTTLTQLVRASPNISVLEHHIAIDLIHAAKLGLSGPRCLGLYALDKTTGLVQTIGAQRVILASGGAGKVYLYTTNPDTATGDGIAMGWRA